MNRIIRLVCYFLLLNLAACAHQVKSDIKPCLAMCEQRLQECKQTCSNNCVNCTAEANASARANYLHYLHEQQIQGESVTRSLKSYRDPLQCRKVTCNCSSDFYTCEQQCTGVIRKKLRPLPYCS